MKIEQKKWLKEKGWVTVSDNNLEGAAQVVFLFGDRNLLKDENNYAPLKELYPKAQIVGCSTAGEILGTQVLDNSLVATAVFFEHTNIQVASICINNMDESMQAGENLAASLQGDSLTHVLVLSEGLNVNGSSLARGLVKGLPADVVVTGGLAGDQARFEETIIVHNEEAAKDMIVAVGFYGDRIKIGYGSMGGWDSFGPDRMITRSEGNILYELDGQPALQLYKSYLGDHAKDLPAAGLLFPLSIRLKEKEGNLVRTILSVNEEKQSMTFAGDLPESHYARLMKANSERLVDGASGAANMSIQTHNLKNSNFAILISCVGRKLVLKQRIEEEIEAVQEILGQQTFLTGFYSYGEICPTTTTEKQCKLHNQTMTITTFLEE